jgi:hypothetical protein
MRKKVIAVLAAVTLGAVGGAPAVAAVSTTQTLPSHACNQGTMNAHENIPETTGSGKTTPGHMAVPGTENVTPCGHGG